MKPKILRIFTRRPVYVIRVDRYTPHRNIELQGRTGLQHSRGPVLAKKSISLDWVDRSSTFLKTGTRNKFSFSVHWRPVFHFLEDRYTHSKHPHWLVKTGLSISGRPVHAEQRLLCFKGTGLQLSWRPVHAWAKPKFSKIASDDPGATTNTSSNFTNFQKRTEGLPRKPRRAENS